MRTRKKEKEKKQRAHLHLEQLGRNNDDGRGAIAHLLILQPGQIDEHLGSGMLHIELGENGGAIVGDHDLASSVDDHLVEPGGPQ